MADELLLTPSSKVYQRMIYTAHNTEAECFEAGKKVQLEHDRAQLAKVLKHKGGFPVLTTPEQKEAHKVYLARLDRPELKKEIVELVRAGNRVNNCTITAFDVADQILALIPDEEEIRKQESEAVIRCITDAKRVHPDWGIDKILELLRFREETREAIRNQSGNFISLEELRQALKRGE